MKKITVPTQKTFIFGLGDNQDKIDKEINEWLTEMAKKGTAPLLGKVSCNHPTGDMYFVFMYAETIEVEDKK